MGSPTNRRFFAPEVCCVEVHLDASLAVVEAWACYAGGSVLGQTSVSTGRLSFRLGRISGHVGLVSGCAGDSFTRGLLRPLLVDALPTPGGVEIGRGLTYWPCFLQAQGLGLY